MITTTGAGVVEVTKLVTNKTAGGRRRSGRRSGCGRQRRFPLRERERVEVVLAVHRGQADEQVADIRLRVVAVAKAGDDDRVEMAVRLPASGGR